MEIRENSTFPPKLIVGNRVWTASGYRDHGPEYGPKVDIAPNQGGTITASQENGYTKIIGDLLHTVRWDNGQVSKHYSRELFRIGRFQSRTEFEQAIKPAGVAELTIGPAGAFRHVRLELDYDGKHQTAELYDQAFWAECVEPIVKKSGCTISITRLPSKKEIAKLRPRSELPERLSPVALAEGSHSAGVHHLRLGLDVCLGEERFARCRAAHLQCASLRFGGCDSGDHLPRTPGKSQPADGVCGRLGGLLPVRGLPVPEPWLAADHALQVGLSDRHLRGAGSGLSRPILASTSEWVDAGGSGGGLCGVISAGGTRRDRPRRNQSGRSC